MYSVQKKPIVALSGIVKHLWYFRLDEAELPFSQLCFPYGNFELICYLKHPNDMQWFGSFKQFTEPEIFYAGQVTKPFILKFNKSCECVGVSFHPWAGNILFNIPAYKFTNSLVPLADLKMDFSLYDQLKKCAGEDALFACLENFLIGRLALSKTDRLVQGIITDLCHSLQTPTTPKPSYDHYGLSRRRIEQRFKECVGLSILNYRSKLRFHQSLQTILSKDQEENLTTIGLQCGYYDQSHFIHDFKKFAGVSPKAFQKNQTDLTAFFKSLV